MRGWRPYLLLLAVLAGALAVGARAGRESRTPAARADRIAQEVRCPTCEGLSAAESDTPAAREVRQRIRRGVAEGETDGEILAFLVSRYGKDILLKPEATGLAALVWALPVAAAICAAAALALAFRRWKARPSAEVSAEDRRLVEQALRR